MTNKEYWTKVAAMPFMGALLVVFLPAVGLAIPLYELGKAIYKRVKPETTTRFAAE